jgi:co-chaperonin GroES (HSP10)
MPNKTCTKCGIVISNRANTMKQDASLDEIIALGKWAEKQKAG